MMRGSTVLHAGDRDPSRGLRLSLGPLSCFCGPARVDQERETTGLAADVASDEGPVLPVGGGQEQEPHEVQPPLEQSSLRAFDRGERDLEAERQRRRSTRQRKNTLVMYGEAGLGHPTIRPRQLEVRETKAAIATSESAMPARTSATSASCSPRRRRVSFQHGPPLCAEGDELAVGDVVTLLTTLYERQVPGKDGEVIPAGFSGTIAEVDSCGDLLLSSPQDKTRRWILAKHAKELSNAVKPGVGFSSSLRRCFAGICCCGDVRGPGRTAALGKSRGLENGSGDSAPIARERSRSKGICQVRSGSRGTLCSISSEQREMTVAELKSLIEGAAGVPVMEQDLFLNQRLLIEDSERPLLTMDPQKPATIELHRTPPRNLSDFYEVGKRKLGEGSFAHVVRAVHCETRAERALKVFSKAQGKQHSSWVKNELQLMRALDHRNVVRWHDTFEDVSCIYFVLDLCKGGPLMHRILALGHFTERDASRIVKQIVEGVGHMHDRLVCHRDLKPPNVLFEARAPIDASVVKIIDLGSATRFERGVPMRVKVFSPHYGSPQVHAGEYTEACDLWSCGVLVFVLLSGHAPFGAEADAAVVDAVRAGRIPFGEAWAQLSPEAKDIAGRLLAVEEADRLKPRQALEHAWLAEEAPRARGEGLQHLGLLKGCVSTNRLKKASLRFIARQDTCGVARRLLAAFEELDDMGHGMLSPGEIREALDLAQVQGADDIRRVAGDAAAAGMPWVSWPEVLARKVALEQESDCRAAFNALDLNGDGSVSLDEIAQFLITGTDADVDIDVDEIVKDVSRILQQADVNHDGVLDFNEFMQMMSAEIG